ncbi:MAG: N-succinylarginine dihydrolase [Bdellovibrionia bacterium]
MARAYEVNFDGLVGPTHNYSGLSLGNIASTGNRASVSNPQEAALQGLEKMRYLAQLGMKQGVLPPQERPFIPALKKLGFSGSDKQILRKAAAEAPEILSACYSASSMWTANAATVSPSADTTDGKVHFTPANLISKFHRSIEPETTARILKAIFKNKKHFAHHDPLPPGMYFGDEGAANHTRFCAEYGKPGVEFFVYGRKAFGTPGPEPKRYPARQTLEASSAVARLHELDPKTVIFAQQSPEAIDAGVFHNDVASVGNRDLLFYHEKAFLDASQTLRGLRDAYSSVCEGEFRSLEVKESQVSMADAVKSYLFNSQLLTLPDGTTALLAPMECQETESVRRYIDCLSKDAQSPIQSFHFLDLRQSMRNGGGPACLRLRVVLTKAEMKACSGRVFIEKDDDKLYKKLVAWVKKHYRDQLSMDDLADPALLNECRTALDELTQILKLGSIYPFQL